MADRRRTADGTSRRDFIKLSSLAAMAAAGGAASGWLGRPARASSPRGNALPGRIVMLHDAAVHGQGTIDPARAEAAVHQGVRLLTGAGDTGEAFASLFPGLTASSTIAIKVNCIGPCDTRWETVRGIVAGLALMLDGAYDLTRVRIFDNRYIGGHGYTNVNFDFAGVRPHIATAPLCSSGYYPVAGHQLSDYLYGSDYLINVPALKSHTTPHEITVSLKNHYGSCCPADLCGSGGPPTMLALNADAHIRSKTALVVTDGLRGTYNGGPGESPQLWASFPEGAPNTLFFSTDPITTDYWARDLINSERALRGWSLKTCAWIEQGAAEPYSLGIADPQAMDVVRYDPAGAPEAFLPPQGGLVLAANAPNPFRDGTTLRLRLERPGRADLAIFDPSGRLVRVFPERDYPAGYSAVGWDGRDESGRPVGPGAYWARLRSGARSSSRLLLRTE